MNENELLYIYNPQQAEYMIRELKGKHLHRIGKGGKGDILITFIKNNDSIQVMNKWKAENPNT
jgi:hypothetical protein